LQIVSTDGVARRILLATMPVIPIIEICDEEDEEDKERGVQTTG
jgi:hypothetical protein